MERKRLSTHEHEHRPVSRVIGQQSDRESCLQIIVVHQLTNFFFKRCLLKLAMMMSLTPISMMSSILTAINVDDWVGDDQIIELTCRNPSKMAEAMAIKVKLLLL